MLCDECNKNLATVHLTKVVNGQMSKAHLCEECAQEVTGEVPSLFDFSHLIASIPQVIAALFEPGIGDLQGLGEEALRCESCGSSFDDLRETGRVGCSACYDSFADRMEPLLRRMHGSSEHKGKVPSRGGRHILAAIRSNELRSELERHIAAEAFEEAARVRDEIRALEAEHPKDDGVGRP